MQGVILRRFAVAAMDRRGSQEPERARRPSRTFLAGLLAATSAALSILGCAESELKGENALRRGPLPYHVGIFVELKAGPSEAQAGIPAEDQARFLQSSVEVAHSLEKALLESPSTVSKVKVISASDRREAMEAARGLDALLVAGIAVPEEFADYDRSPGWAVLEVGCWLFGGVPAWFVPTVKFMTHARASVEGLDLHQKAIREWHAALKAGARPASSNEAEALPAFDWQETFESDTHNLSLWDRSHPFDHPLDYLATLLVPPMVLAPGDPARLSRKLTDEISEDWGERVAAGVKDRFLAAESKRPLSIVFVSPPPMGRVEAESLRLRLDISSRATGEATSLQLAGLEVFRFARETALFQWRASKADLEALQGALDALRDKNEYVLWDVPVDVPLEVGPNTIKVRVHRSDGEQVIRTMVYSH
jgi:hypothetical protein